LPTKPQVPEDTRRLLVEAQVLVEAKDYQGAIDRYTQAEVEAPWFAQLQYYRAMLLSSLEKHDDAIDEKQAYLSLAPDAQDARVSRIRFTSGNSRRNALRPHILKHAIQTP